MSKDERNPVRFPGSLASEWETWRAASEHHQRFPWFFMHPNVMSLSHSRVKTNAYPGQTGRLAFTANLANKKMHVDVLFLAGCDVFWFHQTG